MSLHTYDYRFSGGVLNCELDYQPPERTTHWDPGCSAAMELTAVNHKGVDIYDLLDPKLKRVIEIRALDDQFAALRDQADDARIEAYRDRTERDYA